MNRPRVIPILGIQNKKLVKTVKYKRPNYLGDPINAIKIYNDKEVDELAIVDIRASKDKSHPKYEHLFEMAGEAFMPIAYGGGVDTFEKAKKVFDCGIEKIILNSGYFANPNLVNEIAETFGAQSVVLSLDLNKNIFGKYVLTTSSGSKSLKLKLSNFLANLDTSNIGEILINDITLDGTFKGYNLPLIDQVSKAVKIPVIANCGCNGFENLNQAIKSGASAVAASSIFVYKNNNPESILINYPHYKAINDLR